MTDEEERAEFLKKADAFVAQLRCTKPGKMFVLCIMCDMQGNHYATFSNFPEEEQKGLAASFVMHGAQVDRVTLGPLGKA